MTISFPQAEKFALCDQLRRASSSVPANIAEGMGRGSQKEMKKYLYIARGSAQEVIYFCMLSRDLGYVTNEIAGTLIDDYNGLSAGITAFANNIKERH